MDELVDRWQSIAADARSEVLTVFEHLLTKGSIVNAAIHIEVQLDSHSEVTEDKSGFDLRTLDAAELIHVGGGYMAADY